MRKKKNKKISKKKLQQFLKKKFKYYKMLRVKENTDMIAKKNNLLKYNFFRRSNFLYFLPKPKILKKKNFLKEITEIMFGFGDIETPGKRTIILLQKILIHYLNNLSASIAYISFWRIKRRPTVEDIFFLVRNNPKNLGKINYLLKMKSLFENIMGSDKKNSPLKGKFMFPLKISKLK
jgi:hypothetical protein